MLFYPFVAPFQEPIRTNRNGVPTARCVPDGEHRLLARAQDMQNNVVTAVPDGKPPAGPQQRCLIVRDRQTPRRGL